MKAFRQKLFSLCLGLSILLSPVLAHASTLFPTGGGTGSSTLSGVLLGAGVAPVQTLGIGSGLQLSGGILSATGSTFAYPFPGNATTTILTFTNGLIGNLTGNASTATALQTPRNINGVSFNGTSNITINAASSTALTDNNTWSGTNIFSIAPKLGFLTGIISGNSGNLYTSATTTASCAGTNSCTPFTIFGNSPVTITGSGGGGGSGTVGTSSSETAGYFPTWTTTNGTPALLAGTSQLFQNGSNVGVGSTSPTFPLSVTGQTYIGPGGLPSGSLGAAFNTFTSDLNTYALADSFQALGSLNSGASFQALQFNVTDNGGNNVNTMQGINGLAIKSGTGSVGTLIAIQGSPRLVTSATATTMEGFRAQIRTPAGTAASTTIGFSVVAPTSGGLITNSYGVKVAAQKNTGVTTGYGFASDGVSDLNYVLGLFGIGTSTPGTGLSIGLTGGINIGTTGTSTWGSSVNGINITNGCFSVAGVCVGSGAGTVTSVTGTYPVISSGGATPAISLAFGTTTSNIWAGTQTFTNSPIFSTVGAGTVNSTAAGTIYNTATSTPTVTAPITYSGTLGSFIGGVSGAFGCVVATGSVSGCLAPADFTNFNNKISSSSLSVTTTGTSGAATYTPSTGVFNIPQYQAGGNYITALTGDGTASGPGSAVFTLATVNSNIGTFNNFTVNGKGLITAASNVGYSTAGYPFFVTGNATSTLTQFNGGLTAFASSTIGNGTQAGGLTISGGATTTGNLDVDGGMISIRAGTTNGTYPAVLALGGTVAASYSAIEATNNSLITINKSGFPTVSFGGNLSNNVVGIGSTTPWGKFAVDTTNIVGAGPEFNVGSSVRTDFVITQSGNVGIGSTTPGSLFSVGSQGTGTNFFNNATTTKDGVGGYNITQGCYAVAGVCLSSGSSLVGTTGQVPYFTGTNTAAGTSTIFVATNANVGIGSTTPSAKLSVSGIASSIVSSLFAVASSTGNAIFNVLNNGTVGIGTTTPSTTFAIDDNDSLSVASSSSWSTAGTYTYTVPANTAYVVVQMFSGGGGGGVRTGGNAGAGGSAGTFIASTTLTATQIGSSQTLIVGQGGRGATSATFGAGGTGFASGGSGAGSGTTWGAGGGGSSAFGSLVVGGGGGGGAGGGSQGTIAACPGTSGGVGGNGVGGPGGGGAAATNGANGVGTGGGGPGTGGTSCTGTSGNGGGNNPGGGGSSAGVSGNGAAGTTTGGAGSGGAAAGANGTGADSGGGGNGTLPGAGQAGGTGAGGGGGSTSGGNGGDGRVIVTAYAYAVPEIPKFSIYTLFTNGIKYATEIIDQFGHLLTSGLPPTFTACGTTPTFVGPANDRNMTFNVGSGVVTSCTVNFANAFPANSTVVCPISEISGGTTVQALASTTPTGVVITGGTITSDRFTMHCEAAQ